MAEVLWRPDADRIARAHLTRFQSRFRTADTDYRDLWEWSVRHPDRFWQAVWEYTGVVASSTAETVLASDAMPGAMWFPGSRLNFAENLLRRTDDGIAVIVAGEGRATQRITWARLNALVAAFQESLRRAGVGSGDRVAGLLPNGLEAVVAMLAATATGAVWSSCSPDFGPTGIVDRFGQIEPKVLIVPDGYRYNGKAYPVGETVRAVRTRLTGVELVVAVDVIGDAGDLGGPVRPFTELVASGPDRPDFVQLPFDHPVYIMYSSGTTGPPKSIVHGAGGTLLKHLCEHQLHCDVHRDDVVFWFTTCGWMMWNWLVSALGSGASIVLYDGSPGYPDLGALWRLAAESGITHFGTSPKFLAANAGAAAVPRDIADLSRLRWLGSTGAPLNPEQFDWVYSNVKSDVQLASISGGTDIIGCFACGVPTLPVRRGELQARALGMAVESWDESGRPQTGVKGELVCTRPFPSMPVAFWKDPDGERYRQAYFAEHPGVWTHGDFIEIRPEGGVVIYGRSDTTLNPGGVRIGTAEIYRAIETMPAVEDSVVVGLPDDGDVSVVLFVRLREGETLDDMLRQEIREQIRRETSPRHVPARIHAVPDIPYTLSGKKVEKAVLKTLLGEEVANRDALANPESLDGFRAADLTSE